MDSRGTVVAAKGIMLALLAVSATAAWAQTGDNRTILGAGNEYLSAGAFALLSGRYEEGIRLTELGLTRYAPRPEDRALALSNLCAAHAALNQPDVAIRYCSESLALNSHNWRAFNNRSYAYTLKNMYSEAMFDIDAAAALNPDANQVIRIKGMINERTLQPRIIIEDHH
jgi:tetratricopeptide (TPR) repeat protein